MMNLNGDLSSLETINAAATVISSTRNRSPRVTARKKRWGSWWSIIWSCFGNHRNQKRICHAVLLPERTTAPPDAVIEHRIESTSMVLPFIAPPSSPVSFIHSEPPSVTQSPQGLLKMTAISNTNCSPIRPHSMFAIGPYAHETQLVSPPVFSTATTEPSTAPVTPLTESVHLTTPSSPEVPFARLLSPNHSISESNMMFPFFHSELQSIELYPRSQSGYLASPGSFLSGSGTSSPFREREFANFSANFLEFQKNEPPIGLNHDRLHVCRWGPHVVSGSSTPDTARLSSQDGFPISCPTLDALPNESSVDDCQKHDIFNDDSMSPKSFASDVTGYLRDKSCALEEAAAPSPTIRSETDISNLGNIHNDLIGRTSDNAAQKVPLDHEQEKHHHHRHYTISLGSIIEFNFDNAGTANANVPDNSGSTCWGENEVAHENCTGGASDNAVEKVPVDNEQERLHHHRHYSISLGSIKEFNFDNANTANVHGTEPGSARWNDKKAVKEENGPAENWPFFLPVVEAGSVS